MKSDSVLLADDKISPPPTDFKKEVVYLTKLLVMALTLCEKGGGLVGADPELRKWWTIHRPDPDRRVK